jgi:hypothetical protein
MAYRAVRKLLPKRVRSREVREEREAMSAMAHSLTVGSDIEEQVNIPDVAIGVASAGAAVMIGKAAMGIRNLFNKTGKVMDKADTVLTQIVSLIEGLKAQATQLMGMLWVLPCAILVYWLSNAIGDNRILWAGLALLLAKVFGQQLWDFISPYFRVGIKPQGPSDPTMLVGLVVAVLSFSFLPTKASSLVPALMQRISFFPKATEGLQGMYNFAVSICETVLNLVFQVAGVRGEDGAIKVVYFGDAVSKAVKKWVKDSHKFAGELRLSLDIDTIMRAQQHVSDGYAMLEIVKEKRMLDIMTRALRDFEEKCRATAPIFVGGDNLRTEPMMTLIVGDPGVGKTCMVSRLALCILLVSKQVTPDHALRNLWQKGSSEYWNGYVQQKAVIFDDIFQKIDTVGCAESEVMDVIRMISNWTFPLNMADLESKGKIQFDSPLVIGTTNCYNINKSTWNQVINSKDALLRRIHHPVFVSVNKDYAIDGRLDYNKFEEEYTANIAALKDVENITVEQYVDAVPWHAWDAWRISNYDKFVGPKDPQCNARTKIQLGQFVRDCARELQSKQARHKASLGALLDHAKLANRIQTQMDEITPARSESSYNPPPLEEEIIDELVLGPQPETDSEGMAPVSVGLEEEVPQEEVRGNTYPPNHFLRQHHIAERELPRVNLIPIRPSEVEDTEPLDPNAPSWLERYRRDHEARNPNIERQRLRTAVWSYATSQPRCLTKADFDRLDVMGSWKQHWLAFFAGFTHRSAAFSEFLRVRSEPIVRALERAETNGFDLSITDRTALINGYNQIVKAMQDVRVVESWGINRPTYDSIVVSLHCLYKEIRHAGDLLEDLDSAVAEEFSFLNNLKRVYEFIRDSWNSGRFGMMATAVGCAALCGGITISLIRGFWLILKGVVGLIAKFFGFKDPTVEPPIVVDVPIEEQNSAAGAESDSTLVNTYSANTYSLWHINANQSLGNLTFLGGTVAAVPKHYFHHLAKVMAKTDISEHMLTLLQNGDRSRPKFTVKQFLSFPQWDHDPNSDVVFVQFPRDMGIQARRDITGKFVPEAKLNTVARHKPGVVLYTLRCASAPNDNNVRILGTQFHSPYVNRVRERAVGEVTPEFLWQSSMDTICGDCGGFLMIRRSADAPEGRILGIHVGGNNSMGCSYGYVQPITRETAEAALKHFTEVIDKAEEDMQTQGITLHTGCDYSELVEGGLIKGSFDYIGTVEPSDGVSLSPVTCLQKTALYYEKTFGDSGLDIAHLRPVMVDGELKYPMVEALKNYQTPVEYVDIPSKKLLFNVAMQKFTELSATHTRDILGFEEACSGPLLLKMKAINRSTSSGYPYVLMGKPGKTAFFGYGDTFDFEGKDCTELKTRVFHIIEEAKKGVRLSHICLDFLKDETRPEAKVAAVATRAISGSPVDYVIAFRMLFGSFMAAMYATHTNSGFTPGINPYRQWWQLASNHRCGGSKSHGHEKFYFDGDFSRFDASEQPFLLWSILDYINEWYDDGPENALARKVLWMEVVHSRHITTLQGKSVHVVQWNKSLPSGHPMTTIINSMYAMFSLVYCYAKTDW